MGVPLAWPAPKKLTTEAGVIDMWRRSLWTLVFMFFVSGCALTPDYERPETKLPETWDQIRDQDARESIANLKWWEIYQDETLTRLI